MTTFPLTTQFSSHNANRAFPVRHLPGKVGILLPADRFSESQKACSERRGRMLRFRCEAKCLDGPAPFAHLSAYGNRIWASRTLPSSVCRFSQDSTRNASFRSKQKS